MKTLTISTLKNDIDEYFEQVSLSGELLVIPGTKVDNGIVIMSIQEYNSFLETAHLLSTAANQKRLQESINQLHNNETVSYIID